jgi:hypothetical protein
MPENKPISQRYYPSLSDFVNEDNVPQFLKTFLFGDRTNPGTLSKVFYRKSIIWTILASKSEMPSQTKNYVPEIISRL